MCCNRMKAGCNLLCRVIRKETIRDIPVYSTIYCIGLFWLIVGCYNVPLAKSDPNIIMPESTSLTKLIIANPIPTEFIIAFSTGYIGTGVMGCFFTENGKLTSCQLWVTIAINLIFGSFCIIMSIIYTTQIVVAATTMIFTILWMRNWALVHRPRQFMYHHNEHHSTGDVEIYHIPTAQPIKQASDGQDCGSSIAIHV